MSITSLRSTAPVKLDMYDKRIIFYLSQDSRMQRTMLAKKLRISVPRLQYKIDRLVKGILSPAPNLNFPALGIPSYIILAQELPPNVRIRLLETSTFWFFTRAIGKYPYVMNVITDDIENFCARELADCRFEIHPIIKYIPDDYDPWNLKITPKPAAKDTPLPLDKKDYALLAHLGTGATDSYLTISGKTGLDRKTVKARIERMLSHNVIQKFRYGINIFKIDHLVYMVKLDATPHEKRLLLPHLRADNYAGFIFETLTGFVMYYMPPSHRELFAFTSKLSRAAPSMHLDVIETTDVFRVELVPQSAIAVFKRRAKSL